MFSRGINTRLNVQAADVVGVLTEDQSVECASNWLARMACINGYCRALVYCDDISIAVISISDCKWFVEHVACDHQSHGSHPRYKKTIDKLRKLGVFPERDNGTCPKCGGPGFISASTKDGRQAIMMAQGIRMFRGIRLSEDGYRPEQLNASSLRGNVDEFLSGVLKVPRDASAGPVGVVPGRAPLFQTEGDNDEG